MEPRSETIPHLLDEMAARYGESPFVIYRGERVSYADFKALVRRTACGLHSIGVRQGDHVAVWMGNQTEWLVLAFAMSQVGAKFIAINTWWRAKELEHALRLADVDVLIFTRKYIQSDNLGIIRSIENRRAALPRLRTLVCLGESDGGADVVDYRDMLDGASLTRDEVIEGEIGKISPEDVAFILFTSGSSARPKAVQNTHRNLIRNLYQIGERMHLTSEDRIHLSISLFWGFGIANAVFAAMTHGACLVLQHRFDASEALELIERERCTALYATPNMALAMKDHPDRLNRDLSSLRTGLGMPAATSLMIELGASEACSLYGLTECYGNSAVSDASLPAAVRSFTCGSALPNTEIKIADQVTHQPLRPGQTGEIALRGYVMPGYYNGARETSDAMDHDGFFLTGDLGMFDEDGHLHFRGRLKEMIKSGGINVSPAEVEDHLRSHEAIDQALVVGVPDAALDEAVVAVLVLKQGTSADAKTLKAFCRKELATYKVPREFVFITADQVPLTETGKPDKRSLARQMAQSLKSGLV